MAYGTTPQGNATKTTKLTTYMARAPFVRGFTEAQNGMRFSAAMTVEADLFAVEAYERGRQFGLIFKGWLKRGREINSGAVLAFNQALASKAII